MRQARPTTYALMSRCDIGDAAKVMTLADEQDVTMSVIVARLVHEAVRKVTATPKAEEAKEENSAQTQTPKPEATEEMVGKLVKVKITKAGYPYNEGQFVRVLDAVEA